jgi:N-acetylneuraminate synthase
MKIADREIGPHASPFIIAEMSGNHNQSLERALAIVDAAAATGAHAIKFQTYTADTMTIDVRDREFRIDDPGSLWTGKSLYDLYDEAHTPWDWHKPLFARAREKGMIPFSSPFDETAVDFLEGLDAPCYKIASFENTDHALIRKAAATGKPLIMSTGMASIEEIEASVKVARAAGARDIVLLKCTSAYPSTPAAANIATIPDLRERFGCEAGLSDHTMGIGVAVAGVVLGATVIEKHFTLRRADGGVDSAFSMEPEEMAALVTESERAWQAVGRVKYGTSAEDEKSKVFRRSLYIVRDLKAGDVLTAENVRAIRPGLGLPPGDMERVLGRKLRADVKRGTAMRWDLIQ